MDIEEKKEKLLFLQNFFAKSFWISLILLILATVACYYTHSDQVLVVKKLFNMDEQSLNFIIVFTLSLWKLFIVQFNLIPALVIWGIRKGCKCGCGCENK